MQRVGRRTTAVSISMALVLSVAPIIPVIAQEPGEPEAPSPNALISFTGGVAKWKLARTSDTGSVLGAGRVNQWVDLPGATLAYSNLAIGGSDTFNASFSAECAKLGTGRAVIRVRVRNAAGFDSFMSPSGDRTFCSSVTGADANTGTYSGDWVRRLAPDTYTFQVQFLNTGGTVSIDDWSFTIVVHE
jgi:hypothetical protein